MKGIMRTDLADTTYTGHRVLAVSLELAASKWMVALHDGRRDSPTVRFPDFEGLHAAGASVEIATQQAQDALLRHILILIRNEKSIPSPDNYIEEIDEAEIVRLDPLGTCEMPSSEVIPREMS